MAAPRGIRSELFEMGISPAQVDGAEKAGCTSVAEAISFVYDGTKPLDANASALPNILSDAPSGLGPVEAFSGDGALAKNSSDSISSAHSDYRRGSDSNRTATKKSRWNSLSAWGNTPHAGAGAGNETASSSAGRAAQRRVSIAPDEDAQMAAALQASKKDGEDAELAKALDASRQDVSMPPPPPTAATTSAPTDSDADLMRAIQQSLMETKNGGAAPAWTNSGGDPRDRKRRLGGAVAAVGDARAVAATPRVFPATPVGLRNIGNTCYLNSLLQVYYHLPEFRKAVFRWRVDGPVLARLEEWQRTRFSAGSVGTTGAVGAGSAAAVAETFEDMPALMNVDHGAMIVDSSPAMDAGISGAAPILAPVAGFENSVKLDSVAVDGVPEGLSVAQLSSVEFVIELQRLFATMALGNQKVADPSDLVRTMRDTNGRQIVIGDQQDASEFNSLFLDIVERAFMTSAAGAQKDAAAVPETGSVAAGEWDQGMPSSNVVKQMFSATFRQHLDIVDSKDAAATPAIEPKEESTFALVVDATSESGRDLYRGLDDYALAKIDYSVGSEAIVAGRDEKTVETSPTKSVHSGRSGVKEVDTSSTTAGESVPSDSSGQPHRQTAAMKSNWFLRFAPVLTIYLQRVVFNRQTAQAEKVHSPYSFGTEIAIDRYLEENRQASEIARGTVNQIRSDRARASDSLKAFRLFGISDSSTKALVSGGSAGCQVQSSVSVLPSGDSNGVQTTSGVNDGLTPEQDAMSVSKDGASSLPDGNEIGDKCMLLDGGRGHSGGTRTPADDMTAVFERITSRIQAAVAKPVTSSVHGTEFIVPGMTQQNCDAFLRLVQQVSSHDQEQIARLELQLDVLRRREAQSYADLNGTKYSLHAVLVHDGAPTSGHYWAYIRNRDCVGSKDRWQKFNDLMVSPVSEDEMLASARGGTGYASAYCLIYALCGTSLPGRPASDVDGGDVVQQDAMELVAKKAPARSVADEGRSLLPQERISEVEAGNERFEREIEEYIARKERDDRDRMARSIVETAISSLRQASETWRAPLPFPYPLFDTFRCGTNSVVEFCVASDKVSLALLHALKNAWGVFMNSASDPEMDLLHFIARPAHGEAAFPPLSSAPSGIYPDDILEPASMVVLEMKRLLNNPSTEYPMDCHLVPRDKCQQVIDALTDQQHVEVLRQDAQDVEILYEFALDAAVLCRHAFHAALTGQWLDSVSYCVAIVHQSPRLYNRNRLVHNAQTLEVVRNAFCQDDAMRAGRRVEDVLRFLPSILSAALLSISPGPSANVGKQVGSTGVSSPKFYDSLYVLLNQLVTDLEERRRLKRMRIAMIGGATPVVSEDLPLQIATAGVAELKRPASSVDESNVIENAHMMALKAISERHSSDTHTVSRMYEKARDELVRLKCDALDMEASKKAGRALVEMASTRTAEA